MTSDYGELFLLFFSAFTAATVFPAQSEVVLLMLHAKGLYSPWLLLCVAGVGNTLGSVVNWVLGRYLIHFQDRAWFPVKGKVLDKATHYYQAYGVWTLLFAWVPFIGDAFTFIAGIFRAPIGVFLVLVAVGKVARYGLLLALA